MSDMTAASDPLLPADWPGRRLGLPEHGPRSVARVGRRIAAVWLDWLIALGIAYLLYSGNSWAILAIFFVLQVIFISTLSGSIGHLIFGMRVVPLTPAWIGVVKPLARSALLCVVIPAVIWDRDQRGLHDRLIGTVLVRK
jgi:RDD family